MPPRGANQDRRSAHLWTALALAGLVAGCLGDVDQQGEVEVTDQDLGGPARRTRSERIRDVGAQFGITNGVLLAGIASVETGLSHCWSEATWACQGPYSWFCRGPVIAGAGDGVCSAQQGGLGLFQFDAGTYQQTLARDGVGVLDLDGNIARVVDFLVGIVILDIPGVSTRAQALAWMNAIPVVAGNATFDRWGALLACRYNGRCGSVAQANKYKTATLNMQSELGAAFWRDHAARRLDLFVRGDGNRMYHRAYEPRIGGWQGFEDLGTVMASAPAVASWGHDRLDIFWTGSDHQLWHRAWDVDHWTTPEALGGAIQEAPSVASWGYGRLDVVARGLDNAVHHKWFEAGAGWSAWENLGGVVTSAPSVTSWGAYHLDIFARGSDSQLWHRGFDLAVGWPAWEPLGGGLTSAPSATSWGDGRIDVFVRGGDLALYHKWYTRGVGWSSYESLGGSLASAPGATSWGLYHLDVFARGSANQVVHIGFDPAVGGWTPWESLGGSINAAPDVASWSHRE